jgi:hypothetical protein
MNDLAVADTLTPVPEVVPPEQDTRPSECVVEIVRIGAVTPHPNPESTMLEVTTVHDGYPCLFRKGDFKRGDRALYVPIDMVVPVTPGTPFAFLARSTERKTERIKARRLKGFFSMGLLVPVPAELVDVPEGVDVAERLGITRYEEHDPYVKGKGNGVVSTNANKYYPTYGIESFRKLGRAFEDRAWLNQPQRPQTTGLQGLIDRMRYKWALWQHGRKLIQAPVEIIVTEKIDGQNWRGAYLSRKADNKVVIGSSGTYRDLNDTSSGNYHSYVARVTGLHEAMQRFPDTVFYGEVYGTPKGGHGKLTYGAKGKNGAVDSDKVALVLFDALDLRTHRWWSFDELQAVATEVFGLSTPPVLYRGPFQGAEHLASLTNGPSVLAEGAHIREGIVVQTAEERRTRKGQRMKMKFVGSDYLESKG